MSDAANAIRNAFRTVFGPNTIMIMCWFHAKKNVRDKVKSILDQQRAKEVLSDLTALHFAPNAKSFAMGVRLFNLKWKSEDELISYLKPMWFKTHKNWFVGSRLGFNVPLTNNALESFNGRLKKDGTQRVRMEFGWFLNTMIMKISQWSCSINYRQTTTIPIKLWKQGLESVGTSDPVDISTNPGNNIRALFPKTSGDVITDDEKKARLSTKWQNFSSYASSIMSIYETTLVVSDWQNSKCTCPEFVLDYICVHILDLAIRQKLTVVPDMAKPNLIADKAKRGRARKLTHPLKKD